jgi:hypothetical protein
MAGVVAVTLDQQCRYRSAFHGNYRNGAEHHAIGPLLGSIALTVNLICMKLYAAQRITESETDLRPCRLICIGSRFERCLLKGGGTCPHAALAFGVNFAGWLIAA